MKKPCEYCSDELTTITSDLGEDLTVEVYPGKMIAAIAFFRNQSEELEQATCSIPMNYCPNCGRRLG